MTAPAAAPTTPRASAEPGTEYVILSRNDEAGRIVYVHEKNVTARDTDKAIEKYAEQNDNKPGTFIAIPASRWKPVKVTAQTVTTLKLEEAK
jgi:hypothetical protein